MNPTVPQAVIDQAYADDAISAASEFGAEWKSDLENFVDQELVTACVDAGVHEIAPAPLNQASSATRLSKPSRQLCAKFAKSLTACVTEQVCNTGPAVSSKPICSEMWCLSADSGGEGVLNRSNSISLRRGSHCGVTNRTLPGPVTAVLARLM
jgi:hypothetical protein